MGAVDVAALGLSLTLSAVVTAVVAFFANSGTRRDWIIAGVVTLALMIAGIVDLLFERPRETHMATAVVGAVLPVAGAMGLTRATRGVRPWARWLAVFLTTFILLLGGVLLGASILPRFLGG